MSKLKVAIIGGGPTGLMAAEQIAQAGITTHVFDTKPSVGRKFLVAGAGGMNITHSEPYEAFVRRYGKRHTELQAILEQFNPDDLCQWMKGLGIGSFVGSSGRIFPDDMKSAPLLRTWLSRLRKQGVEFFTRHRCIDIVQTTLTFETREGQLTAEYDAVLLAMGGASWKKLGSDGAWSKWPLLQGHCEPFMPSNCGFTVNWSEYLIDKCAGQPLKNIELSVLVDGERVRRNGELVLTEYGVEGGVIYALGEMIRRTIKDQNNVVKIDLLPNHSTEKLHKLLAQKNNKQSLPQFFKKQLKLSPAAIAIFYECTEKDKFHLHDYVAKQLKALPLALAASRPIDEAISTAGGVSFEALDENLMLKDVAGVFAAGEMLDWDAPTGGYLLTACFASGFVAGHSIRDYLNQR